jgi:hypothetical protein
MISTISAILTSLMTAKELADAMISLRDAEALQTKRKEFLDLMIDAQIKILALQDEHSQMREAKRDLEEQIAAFERWDHEKLRYELKEIGPGVFTYIIKPSMQGMEPTHCICAHCYQQDKKSILQAFNSYTLGASATCPACKTTLNFDASDPRSPFNFK